MELWELEARESIRDLVARYNANGDTGRVPQVLSCFAKDAVMETVDFNSGAVSTFKGHDEIATIFTGAKDRWGSVAAERKAPAYVRHNTSSLQIDLVDQNIAKARCYFVVLMAHGIDHWGRYVDEYAKVDGTWLFKKRRVTLDGTSSNSVHQ